MNTELFIAPLFENNTSDDFDCIPSNGIKTIQTDAGLFTLVSGHVLQDTAQKAFERLSFTFPRSHLDNLIRISKDSDSSSNDKLIAAYLLQNAAEAAHGVYPLCQDTGIATVFGWRGRRFIVTSPEFSDKDKAAAVQHGDEFWLEKGIENVYTSRNLRFSTNIPVSMFDEYDPGNNMPAHIEMFAGGMSSTKSDDVCSFIFSAKGGGSSNKTVFLQETKAVLNENQFTALLKKHISALGTSACPPYSIAVIVGGLSPEQNVTALKLATLGAFSGCIPSDESKKKSSSPLFLRDAHWERVVMDIAAQTSYGAQFGGTKLAVNATVLRLPRHGASCFISIGVSCSAHRNLLAYIDSNGIHLQKTVNDPSRLPGFSEAVAAGQIKNMTAVDLNNGIHAACLQLDNLQPGTFVSLSGKILVARDKAHARWKELFEKTGKLPDYTKHYPICYAGPAQTPQDEIIGSFGPTTAGRMDSYADMLMSNGASLISIAKGNRSTAVADACKTYGGFYLGTPGGTAALIAKKYITAVEILDYPEFGMEAVRLVTVKDLPTCILIDNKGNDFYRTRADIRL